MCEIPDTIYGVATITGTASFDLRKVEHKTFAGGIRNYSHIYQESSTYTSF